MNTRSIAVVIASALLAPALTHAQEKLFAPVEYVSSDVKWKCGNQCLTTLVLEDGALMLTERKKKNARIIISVPIATVVKVTNRIDTNGPNAAAVAAFGIWGLASRRHDEYVSITSETATHTENFIVKVEKNTSDGIVAKIDFAARQAKSKASESAGK